VLAEHGWLFRPVDPKDVVKPIVSVDVAKRTAVHEYGVPDNDLSVYLGRLTPLRTEVIDPRTLAYAVQIRGVSLPPIGAPTAPGTEHHELVVFVDARTGKMSSSRRRFDEHHGSSQACLHRVVGAFAAVTREMRQCCGGRGALASEKSSRISGQIGL
jgi:hypothetical protein